MKLTVLVDNNSYIDEYYVSEPGLSFYIEDGNTKVLFDTGYSDVFLKNAKDMNIDLSKINYLVLSHGHNDHTGGLKYLKENDLSNVKLIAHKGVFDKREKNGLDISSPVSLEELKVKEYIEGSKLIQITDKLYFLGQINRTIDFEGLPVGIKTETKSSDYVIDDSALVYKAEDGLFIITACSHSGICNIIENAKSNLNENRIKGIIGGFHLLKNDRQLSETVKYLKATNIQDIYPCHCVNLYAKHRLYEVGNLHEVGVGLTLSID